MTLFANHRAIGSNHIASVGYEDQTLEVLFKNGAVYRYSGVPPHIVNHLISTDRAGAYLHSTIIGHYPEVKVRERSP